MNFKAIFGLVKDTFKEWSEDKAARLGAALSYYTIFSIGPLLLIAVAIASFVFANAQGQIVTTIQGVVGKQSADVIAQTMDNANKSGANIFATVIGIVTLLLGASGVFGQLKDALNTIWEVQPKPGLGLLNTLKERFLSFSMVLGTGFLLLVSLIVSAAVAALTGFLRSILPGGDIIGFVVSIATSLLVITLMFMLLFKFLPDIKIAWGDVWIGGLVTAILFLLGQYALSLYIGSGAVGTSFGAVSALVIILVWIYYSAQILFLGAEFTQVYTNRYGSRVQPKENAEIVTEEDRAQQGIPGKEGREERKSGGKAGKPAKPGEQKGTRKRLKTSPWFQ